MEGVVETVAEELVSSGGHIVNTIVEATPSTEDLKTVGKTLTTNVTKLAENVGQTISTTGTKAVTLMKDGVQTVITTTETVIIPAVLSTVNLTTSGGRRTPVNKTTTTTTTETGFPPLPTNNNFSIEEEDDENEEGEEEEVTIEGPDGTSTVVKRKKKKIVPVPETITGVDSRSNTASPVPNTGAARLTSFIPSLPTNQDIQKAYEITKDTAVTVGTKVTTTANYAVNVVKTEANNAVTKAADTSIGRAIAPVAVAATTRINEIGTNTVAMVTPVLGPVMTSTKSVFESAQKNAVGLFGQLAAGLRVPLPTTGQPTTTTTTTITENNTTTTINTNNDNNNVTNTTSNSVETTTTTTETLTTESTTNNSNESETLIV